MTAPSAITDPRLGRPSASDFERIMNCDGYLALKRDVDNQRVRPSGESQAATAGTELHELNESGDTSEATYTEEQIVQLIRDREIMLVQQWCADFDIPFDQITIEREVRLWFMDVCSCQLDVLVTFGSHGFYLDTKTGRNKVPPPSRNWQLRCGAACARHERHLDHVRTAIVNVWGALMPPCDYPMADLHQISRIISRRLMAVEEPGQPTNLGPWCANCAAAHVCPSQRDQMALAIQQRRINWDLVKPEQKKGLFIAAKMAVDAGKLILDQVKADLAAGLECPGLEKKPDSTTRKIVDLQKARTVMAEQCGLTSEEFSGFLLKSASISIEDFVTLYRDLSGSNKDQAESFLETKCADFIEKRPRSGSVKVLEETQPK